MNHEEPPSSDAGRSNSSYNAALIGDSLLALAKDARYVDECRRLWLALLCGDRHSSSDHDVWWWDATATFLSSVLYALTVLRRKGRTLGMESVGLTYNSGGPPLPKWKLVTGALVSAAWVYSVRCWVAVRRRTPSSVLAASNQAVLEDERLTGAPRRRVFEQQRQAMMRRAAAAQQQQPTSAVGRRDNNDDERTTAAAATATTSAEDIISSTSTTERTKKISVVLLSWIDRAADSLNSAFTAPTREGPHEVVSNNATTSTAPSCSGSSVCTLPSTA